ncbi:MAG: dephospho-CoA kinase [Terriglobales bacterium]
MLKLAITGGLCSGKSLVSALLRERGCDVLDADALARELSAGPLRPALAARFGADTSAPRLASIVFAPGAEGELKALEAILHHAIMAETDRRFAALDAAGAACVGLEATLLIEKNLLAEFDRVILVVADLETRIARFMRRSRGSRAEALARMMHQLADEEKVKRLDGRGLVISNNGSIEEMRRQLDQAWARWQDEL